MSNESKHTPGPWMATFYEKAHNPTVSSNSEGHLHVIASVSTMSNARLIAAAPELLEALEELCNTIEPSIGYIITANARRAIAKAKGEAE